MSRRLLGLRQVPSRTNHRRTMRRQRSCRLDPKPRGDSSHENAFAAQINALQDIFWAVLNSNEFILQH